MFSRDTNTRLVTQYTEHYMRELSDNSTVLLKYSCTVLGFSWLCYLHSAEFYKLQGILHERERESQRDGSR